MINTGLPPTPAPISMTTVIAALVQLALAIALAYKYGAFGIGLAIAAGNAWNVVKAIYDKMKSKDASPLVFTVVQNAVLTASALLFTYYFKWPGVAYHILFVLAAYIGVMIATGFGVWKALNSPTTKWNYGNIRIPSKAP